MAEFDRSTGSAAARSVGSSASDGGVDSAHTVLNLADETNAAAATLQAVPVSLGKYQLRQKLGSGAMGAVYLAYDPMIDREVAVKLLPVAVSQDPVALQRFLGEARVAGRLNHPNTIAVYDIGEADGVHYIVMELARGGCVADLVNGQKRPAFREACRVIIEAARGLAAAHKVGLIHRDIKPENLMLAENGTVKIVDFGLSKAVMSESDSQTALTAAGQLLGTPHYMSPEQYQAAPLDARTDIYSLGGTFYRLLTGDFPYGQKSIHQIMYAHLQSPPPDPRKLNPEVSLECAALIAKAMAKSPDDRFADMLQMAAVVERLLAGSDRHTGAADSARKTVPVAPSVLIVEPSKLQARIVKDAFAKAGARSVDVVGSAQVALQAIGKAVPDVIVASRQLRDMPGNDFFNRLDSMTELQDALFVSVTASDDSAAIVTPGARLAHAHVGKQAGVNDILRAIHAATRFRLGQVDFAAAAKKTGTRLLIASGDGKISSALERVIRGTGLLDVSVVSFKQLTAGNLPQRDASLVLVLTGADNLSDAILEQLRDNAVRAAGADAVLAVAVPEGDLLKLRYIRGGTLQVRCDCLLDQERIGRLLAAT